MKRIRTLQDLEYEKMRIRLQRLEQEKSIRQDWDALKLSVAATLLLRNTIDRMTDEKTTPPSWFTGLLQVGTAALGEKVGQLTAQKIETTLNSALRLALEAWRKNRKT
jgi:hypothetical protein